VKSRLRTLSKVSGGDIEKATPDPIPNSEVKLLGADGTAYASRWESRTLPGLFAVRPTSQEVRGSWAAGPHSKECGPSVFCGPPFCGPLAAACRGKSRRGLDGVDLLAVSVNSLAGRAGRRLVAAEAVRRRRGRPRPSRRSFEWAPIRASRAWDVAADRQRVSADTQRCGGDAAVAPLCRSFAQRGPTFRGEIRVPRRLLPSEAGRLRLAR
jgi:hypothetical protein